MCVKLNVNQAYRRLNVEVMWIALHFTQDTARTLPNIRNFRRENCRLKLTALFGRRHFCLYKTQWTAVNIL